MRMNDETNKKINEVYQSNTFNYQATQKLKVDTSLGDTSIYKDNWEICRLGDLSNMIEELTKIRDTIEEVTGIKF